MSRRMSRSILLLVFMMLVALLPVSTAAVNGTIVLVDPPSSTVNLNQTFTLDIKVDTVTNLYAVDVRITFDAAKLEVQDANAGLGGVQIEPGTFLNPAQGFMIQNVADNTTGQIQYAFTLLSPAPAVSGTGVLARITFRAKATGNAQVSFTSVTLSNDQAQPIVATPMPGSVTILPAGTPTTPVPTGTPSVPAPTATPPGTPAPTAVPPPAGVGFPYVVQWGDTVYSIARRFGLPPEAIIRANNLVNPNLIRVGQVLIIPAMPAPPPGPTMYVVQPGDNLYRISLKFKVPIEAIIAVNGIVNPWYICAGQVLIIPTGAPPVPPAARTYIVQRGDTVWSIAAMFRVTPWAIISLNNLVNPNLIFVGQPLLIP
ncbi:MAG: LysM peptidoglycan-binding domain-containing protein [Anaerolineae bacterium]